VDPAAVQGVKAQRYRLLADARRLAILEALGEGPRQVPELARLLNIHPTTVRSHLEKLEEAGVLVAEAGVPSGRGRPSKRYRLRRPMMASDPEVQLFVGSLVSLLRQASGESAAASAEEEGARRGRELARKFKHPSEEQALREVVELLEHLSFAPTQPVPKGDAVEVDIRHCPLRVDPFDPDGAVVCAFHKGLVRGVAEVASDEHVDVSLVPFVAPGVCRVQLRTGPRTESK
jgi:predicted ArsR family transcriptional regulator